MMLKELYINDVLMDLSDDTRIGLNKQANNVGELQNRQGDFTNQFRLPKTLHNRATLESMDNVNSVTAIPYRNNTARYTEDGIDLVTEGIVTAVNSTDQFYIVQVNSGNTSFFGLFPDLKVSQLGIPGLTHLNNFDNIVASRFNTTGYVYPLIDWFNSTNNTAFIDNKVDAPYLVPSIFIKDVFEQIDSLTGYVSKGSFIDSPEYPELILTPESLERSSEAETLYNTTAKNTQDQTTLVGVNNSAPTFLYFTPVLDDFGFGFTGNSYTSDVASTGYFIFSGQLELQYKRYEFQSREIIITVQIVRLSDGVAVESETIFQTLTVLDPAETVVVQNISFSLITNNLAMDPAETYFVRFYYQDTLKSSVNFKTGNVFRFNLIKTIAYGSNLPLGELFNIDVKQVYQDVMNKFGILVQTNTFKREVYFDFFDDIQDNLQDPAKWSDLVDDVSFTVKYKFGKYGRVNHLKHQPNSTVPVDLGDSSFDIDDETLPDQVTVVQLTTSATEEEVRYQGETFPRIRAFTSGSRNMDDVNYRILLLNRKTTAYPIRYFDSTGNQADVMDSIPFAQFGPLDFEVLRPLWYRTLEGMVRRSKVINIKMKLTPKHIQELNYLRPVYLDVHTPKMDINGYFYLNTISNYISGRSASTELIRL